MQRLLIVLSAALGLALAGGRADAGYEFRFADSAGTEKTSFTLDVAQSPTLDIRVYLVATGADATALSSNGLKSYGVQVNYDAAATARVLATGDITNNAAFTGLDGKAVGSTFARSRDSIPTNVASAAGSGSGEQRVLLATFRFTGLSEGDTLAISLDPAGTTDTKLGDNTVLDSLITGQTGVITVQNVPEPGTMVLTGLLAAGIAGGAARRVRRRPATA